MTKRMTSLYTPNSDVLVMNDEYMANGKLQYFYYGANSSECPFQAEWMCRKTTCDALKGVQVQYQRKLYR